MIVMSTVGWLKIFTTIEFNEQQVASCICYFIGDSSELNRSFIWSRNKMNVSSTYYSNNYEVDPYYYADHYNYTEQYILEYGFNQQTSKITGIGYCLFTSVTLALYTRLLTVKKYWLIMQNSKIIRISTWCTCSGF
jgi:hypothetical protein